MTKDNVSCWTRWGGAVKKAVLVGAVALIALPAIADSDSAFTLQGFGTLGLARTTTDDVEFVRDLSQPRGIRNEWSGLIDSVLGLQGTWQVDPRLAVVVQATSRYRYDGTFNPEIAWAFVKFDPTPNLSLRAGRLGTEFFMMADSRWVGYSFLTVRPPGDYFWYLPFYSIHGADVALSVPLGEGVVRAKAFYGLSRGRIPVAETQWDIDNSPMTGAYVEYQHGAWQVRGSYANIRFENDLPIAQVLGLPPQVDLTHLATRGKRAHYYSLGVVYDRGPWQAQLMLNHIEQRSIALESSDGGYALVGYRVSQVTPYLGYSWIRSRQRTIAVTSDFIANLVTPIVMADSHSDQATTFLGARWDFARNLAVKAQWDAIRGTSTSIFPYRKENRARWSGDMDVFSLTLDFVF